MLIMTLPFSLPETPIVLLLLLSREPLLWGGTYPTGCHETALRAWTLCLKQRHGHAAPGAAPSGAPAPPLAAASGASDRALALAEAPVSPYGLTEAAGGPWDGFPSEKKNHAPNPPAASAAVFADAEAPPHLQPSILEPAPSAGPQIQPEALVAGAAAARTAASGVDARAGAAEPLDLWASLSPDKKGLLPGMRDPGDGCLTPFGPLGAAGGAAAAAGSASSTDGELAGSLAVHQAVLRQLRRARFEIDPGR